MGYWRAGFEILGVDIRPQPHYPFPFVQYDALAFPLDGFDAVHASPPCQHYSTATHPDRRARHPDLVAPTRDRLAPLNVPWVIENVPRAPLATIVELCGASLGLEATDTDGTRLVLRRHRLFESNTLLLQPPCACATYRARKVRVAGVYGGGHEDRRIADRNAGGGYTPTVAVRRALMGIDWMSGHELSNAIPPAYTELIGAQLIAARTVDV